MKAYSLLLILNKNYVKNIKDYKNKQVAIQINSIEEFDKIKKLLGWKNPQVGENCLKNKIINEYGISCESDNYGKISWYKNSNYLILPASDFLEFQLPKCFYILRNDVVDEWLSKLSNGIITYSSITRKKYPYFIIEDLKYMGCHYRKNTTESYPEISFEQFQQYVLKENSSNILEQCKKKYLPGTKFMTMANIPKLETIKGIVRWWSSSGNLIVDDNDFIIYEKSSNKFAEIVEETRFKIGKWYKYTREDIIQPSYAKYSSKQSVSDRFYYDEFISVNGYKKGHNWSFLSVKPVLLTDLSEIQQYLPEGHVDKIKSIPEYVEYINEKDKSWKFGKIYKVNGDGTVTFECGSKSRDKSYTTNTTLFKPSTKEAYEAQFVKETVKEWARNTYVVCIKDCENIKENSVYMITHSWGDSDPTIGVNESDKVLSKSNFKWFATKVEAEEFAKTLMTKERWIPNPGDWVVILYTGFKCKGDFKPGDVKQIKDFSLDATVNFKVTFTDFSYGNGYGITQPCFRKAEPHEIPKQTEKEYLKQESIGNYPATKNECVIDLKMSNVLSENILDFPTANRIIYSEKKTELTKLELPTPIKVIKREESYY